MTLKLVASEISSHCRRFKWTRTTTNKVRGARVEGRRWLTSIVEGTVQNTIVKNKLYDVCIVGAGTCGSILTHLLR